jgi:hypothetical protein
MTSRTRESLKNYFREGALPSEDHFADLIDSMLNMSDEGFRKTVENGFEVYAPLGHDALISFFRDQIPDTPLWRMGFDGARNQLLVQGPGAGGNATPALLCLDSEQRVGVATATPETELDVNGTLRSRGRRGAGIRAQAVPLPANGEWHDLSDDLAGCQAFEVMAGAGRRGAGRFSLLHAIALNTYNPTLGRLFDFLFNRKRGITTTQAYYSRRCDRLDLRWHGGSGRDASYRLQIRSRCDFGEGILIQADVTQLWFDPHMEAGHP